MVNNSNMFRGKVVIARRAKPPPEGLLCNYPHRSCMQNRLDGYDYCIKHILEDKTAPYKQCSYIYPKNGKRCPNAAAKHERKDGYCRSHGHKSSLLKQRAYRKIFKPPENPESLIEDLDHYNLVDNYLEGGNDVTERLTPTTLVRLPLNAPLNQISKIIDYTSESDSDLEPVVVDQAWKASFDSDAESIDTEQTDPLKYAAVYTAEEAALITRDKLIRLQSLYIEQFKRLQHLIRERRRKYLLMVKQEKESAGYSHPSQHISAEEADQYKRLKALFHYHRRNGVERLLYIQSKERRKGVTEGINYKPMTFAKCIFPDIDKKCGQRTIPFSKYCMKHILNDANQVLYHPCGFQDNCNSPTIPLFSMNSCVYHQMPSTAMLPPSPETVAPRVGHVTVGDQAESLPRNSADDECGLQSADFGTIPGSDIPSLYGDSSARTGGMGDISHRESTTPKPLWSDCLTTREAKLREELDSIDLTPGELPPEQLLATN